MDSFLEDEITPKRTPRKRVSGTTTRTPRKVVSKTVPIKRAPRRVVPKNAELEDVGDNERDEEEILNSNRKAPTLIATGQMVQKKRKKQTIIIGVVLLIGVGLSAIVGYTDKGQIDVQETIEARNERIRTNTTDERDVNTSTVEVPVQNTNTAGKADGGLVGRGTGGKKVESIENVATSTATSSNQTATSTEVVASSTESIKKDENIIELENSENNGEYLETPTTDL